MLTALAISAALFIAVTVFCRHEGMFDEVSMGIGQLFAGLLYAFVWVLPSALMFIGVWLD
jgi:hypothetical protein